MAMAMAMANFLAAAQEQRKFEASACSLLGVGRPLATSHYLRSNGVRQLSRWWLVDGSRRSHMTWTLRWSATVEPRLSTR